MGQGQSKFSFKRLFLLQFSFDQHQILHVGSMEGLLSSYVLFWQSVCPFVRNRDYSSRQDDFFKRYFSNSFHPINTKLHMQDLWQVFYPAISFFADPSVCLSVIRLCVCVFVRAITFECLFLGTSLLVCR